MLGLIVAHAGLGLATTTPRSAAIYGYDRVTLNAHGVPGRDPFAFSCVAIPNARAAAQTEAWRLLHFLAAKAGVEGADVAFHYTRSEIAALIEKEGLRPGSYLLQRVDHVHVSSDGKVVADHLPLDDWLKWSTWNTP